MDLFKKVLKNTETTLYFPGCLTKAKLTGVVEAQKSVLSDMGIRFVTLEMECCGYPAAWAGYEDEFKTIMERNKRRLQENHISHIITGCPHCALIFKEKYGVETKHLLEVYENHMEKIKLHHGQGAQYHHPCFLDKLGVDEKVAVRILRRAGIHVASENKAHGCCGSVGDDFCRNNPDESKLIAQRRASEFKEPMTATACPYCIMMFKQQQKDVKDVAELLNE